jgi:hypothetical protein
MTLKRIALGLAVLGMALSTVHTAAPAARATAESTPTITAIADDWTYGMVVVSGHNFSAHDPVQIQMLEATTGAWNAVATTSAGSSGTFMKVFSFSVSCSAQAAAQVTVVAVDMTTHETSPSIVVALSTPMALANARLAAAEAAAGGTLSAAAAQRIAAAIISAQAAVAAAKVTMQQMAAACQAAS